MSTKTNDIKLRALGCSPGLRDLPVHLLVNEARFQPFTPRGKHFGRAHTPEQGHQPCSDTGPSRLMAGAETSAVVAMEVLVEQDVVAPVRILLKLRGAAIHRPASVGVAHEDALGKAKRGGDVGRGYVLEYIIIDTSFAKLKAAANASKIEYKVCNDEYVMPDQDLADLKEFVKLVGERGKAK